jgi:signal transduction histidine kinase/CheY-like chemotaxis protein
MLIDSYESPAAQSLLRLGRERHAEPRRVPRRLLVTETAGAAVFIVAAGILAALGSSARHFSVVTCAVMVVMYVTARSVQFPVGSAWTAPTQLVFVPMLFVLPTPFVPLVVATCSLVERLPQVVRWRLGPTRLLAAIGDSFYALGPALVLVLADGQTFAWRHWPLYVAAFGAQIVFDCGAGLARTWFAEGVRPSGQLQMAWLYVTDASLSCIGLLIAASAVGRPALALLALPLVGLMGLLGRERRQRLEYSVALTGAYDEVRQSNEELREKAELLAQKNRDIEIKNDEIELARRGLEEKAAQLALASKYKSEFLANVSHELRTPLNSMLLLSRLLATNERGSLSDREVEFARTISSAGNDLLSLINDVLDLSKVEAGRMEVNLAPIVLADVCAGTEREFRPVADQKGLSFAVELDPGLPPTIVSDQQRLGQVLRNLLSNAFKFTHEGGVRLSVGYPVEDRAGPRSDVLCGEERVVAFTVTDTGVGIPEDKLSLIFEAFRQADGSTARRYGGTGLGLSISREISRLLGAEIQVESVPGLGSRFSLLVPATPRDAWKAVDHPHSAVLPADAARIGRPAVSDDRGRIGPADSVVLVLDSVPERARMTLELVHRRGAKAVVATDTASAVELAREHQAGAVVLAGDAHRIESGLTELKRHADTRHLPVVAIGGLAARLPSLRRGAAVFVERSMDGDALDRALERVDALNKTRARRVALLAGPREGDRLARVLGSIEDVELVRADPSDGVMMLRATPYDLAVIAFDDLQTDAFATLRELVTDDLWSDAPLVAYVARELSKVQRARLEALAKGAVIAVVDSPELLADRATLFLHRAQATLPPSMRNLLDRLRTGDAPLHGRKVLVVDDDIRSGFALTSLLEHHGMKVVYAENGREGLERLHQHANTDLVLLDIMMPEMDGYETARAIRATSHFAELPIIALTAKAMQGDRDKVLAAGASDYIAKPVDIDELLAMMRAWVAPE